MRYILFYFSAFFTSFTFISYSQGFESLMDGGGASDDRVTDVHLDNSGNSVSCGFSDSTDQFQNHYLSGLLECVSSSGVVVWKHKIASWDVSGTRCQLCFKALNTTSDGGFVVTGWERRSYTSQESDLILFRFSSNGTLLWRKNYQTRHDPVNKKYSFCAGCDIWVDYGGLVNPDKIYIAGVANELKNNFAEDVDICGPDYASSRNKSRVWFLCVVDNINYSQVATGVSKIYAPLVSNPYYLDYGFEFKAQGPGNTGIYQTEKPVSITKLDEDGDGW